MAAPADEDAYALLGVETSASAAEIRKAYRQKSLKVHPDRVSCVLSACHEWGDKA